MLLEDISAHPFTGIGKPEALKGKLRGKWSRRINDEHRLVYSVSNNMIYVYVFSMRYHYNTQYGAFLPHPSSPARRGSLRLNEDLSVVSKAYV